MRAETEPKKMLKKNLKPALVRRHAQGQREGGEGHTSYDSLPKGACRSMQNYASYSARRGDLLRILRRAADPNAPRIPPDHAVVWRYHAAFVYLLNLCLLLH